MVEAFNYKVSHQQSASIEKNFSIFYRRLTTLAWFLFSLEWFFTISELLSIAELPLYAEVNVNAETFSMGLKTIRLQLKNIKEEFQWRLHKKIRCHLHRRFLVELYGKHDKKSLSVMTTKKNPFIIDWKTPFLRQFLSCFRFPFAISGFLWRMLRKNLNSEPLKQNQLLKYLKTDCQF